MVPAPGELVAPLKELCKETNKAFVADENQEMGPERTKIRRWRLRSYRWSSTMNELIVQKFRKRRYALLSILLCVYGVIFTRMHQKFGGKKDSNTRTFSKPACDRSTAEEEPAR